MCVCVCVCTYACVRHRYVACVYQVISIVYQLNKCVKFSFKFLVLSHFISLKVNCLVVNEHFGKGTPDYETIGDRRGKWMVQVQGDG